MRVRSALYPPLRVTTFAISACCSFRYRRIVIDDWKPSLRCVRSSVAPAACDLSLTSRRFEHRRRSRGNNVPRQRANVAAAHAVMFSDGSLINSSRLLPLLLFSRAQAALALIVVSRRFRNRRRSASPSGSTPSYQPSIFTATVCIFIVRQQTRQRHGRIRSPIAVVPTVQSRGRAVQRHVNVHIPGTPKTNACDPTDALASQMIHASAWTSLYAGRDFAEMRRAGFFFAFEKDLTFTDGLSRSLSKQSKLAEGLPSPGFVSRSRARIQTPLRIDLAARAASRSFRPFPKPRSARSVATAATRSTLSDRTAARRSARTRTIVCVARNLPSPKRPAATLSISFQADVIQSPPLHNSMMIARCAGRSPDRMRRGMERRRVNSAQNLSFVRATIVAN